MTHLYFSCWRTCDCYLITTDPHPEPHPCPCDGATWCGTHPTPMPADFNATVGHHCADALFDLEVSA